jgi:hypothetical protein
MGDTSSSSQRREYGKHSGTYNESQYSEIRAWIKILYDESRRKSDKAREIIDDHFFDLNYGDKAPTHHAGGGKKKYQYLSVQKRAIVVLIESKEFTLDEIESIVKLEKKQIKRIYKVLKEGV